MIELSDWFNNPSLVEFGSIKIQYYAITWLLSAVLIYFFLKKNKIINEIGLSSDEVNDMVFLYGLFLGAMCGGRIGYMLFYQTQQLINDPVSLFKIWEGGLSFHGGLIGVIIALIVFCKKKNIKFLRLMDGVALSMPIGLGLVRIGNFLNGERQWAGRQRARASSQRAPSPASCSAAPSQTAPPRMIAARQLPRRRRQSVAHRRCTTAPGQFRSRRCSPP